MPRQRGRVAVTQVGRRQAQAVFAQFVVQGFARQAEGFGEAAQGVVRAGQFGGDQRPLIGVDLLAEAAVRRGLLCCRAGERVLQAQLQA